MRFPVAGFQSSTIPAASLVARTSPEGEKTAFCRAALCPANSRIGPPLSTSQIVSLLSQVPVKNRLPSGEKAIVSAIPAVPGVPFAIVLTKAVRVGSEQTTSPEVESSSLVFPPKSQMASSLPSGEKAALRIVFPCLRISFGDRDSRSQMTACPGSSGCSHPAVAANDSPFGEKATDQNRSRTSFNRAGASSNTIGPANSSVSTVDAHEKIAAAQRTPKAFKQKDKPKWVSLPHCVELVAPTRQCMAAGAIANGRRFERKTSILEQQFNQKWSVIRCHRFIDNICLTHFNIRI